MVLQELLTTERTYCGALCLIRTHFGKPLKTREESFWVRKPLPRLPHPLCPLSSVPSRSCACISASHISRGKRNGTKQNGNGN
jgi:hypothetical protein